MTRTRLLLTLIAAVTIAAATMAARQSKAEVTLRRATELELVQGDIKGALILYEQTAREAGTDRALASRGLLKLAQAYEKLGDARAGTTYLALVRDYADQPAATDARAKLSATSAAAGTGRESAGDRVVWSGTEPFGDGDVSPDGRLIAETDWNTGNLVLRDLERNTTRILVESKRWTVGNPYTSTFSPDGKQLAFGWRTYGERGGVNEIRVIDIDAAGAPQSRRILTNDDISVFNPVDWSRDGRWLAVVAERRDKSKEVALVGIRDGSYRRLKTVGWMGPRKVFFSPDGRYLAYDAPPSDERNERDLFIAAVDGSTEVRIEDPSNDVVMSWSPDGRRLLFASDRSGAVGLWTVPITNGRQAGRPTLQKPNISSVHSLGLTTSGTLFVIKDASTDGLQIAPIDLTAGKLTGPPVLQDFNSQYPSWSPDGKQFGYTHTGPNGVPVMSVRSATSSQVRRVPMALQYFRGPEWFPDGKSFATTGRDMKGRTGIYRGDVESGQLTRLLDNELNFSQLSPDGRTLYYGTNYLGPDGAPAAFLARDISTGATRELFRPSDGITGRTRLSVDGRWLATVTTDAKTKVSAITVQQAAGNDRPRTVATLNAPDSFEAFGSLNWTPDGRALLVVKRTQAHPEAEGLWVIPVDGSQPHRLDIDVRGWNIGQGIALHPNGKEIAFNAGDSKREVYAFENIAPSTK